MTSNDDGTEDSFAAPTDCDSTDFYNNSPGTIPQRGCDRPILRYLNRYVVAPIAQVWFEVGLELVEAERKDELYLKMLATEQPNDKRRAIKMLQFWLEKKPDASWKDLIETLRISNIGLHTTAREIEGMLFPETNSQGHQTFIDCASDTSTITTTKSEALILKQNSDQQQHSPEDDAKEEYITGFPTQRKTVMERFPPPNIKSVMKYLNKAIKGKKFINYKHIKVLLTGSSAAGKSSFCRLLFGLKFSAEYVSTEVVENRQALSVGKSVAVRNFGMLSKDGEVVWLELDRKHQINYLKSLLVSKSFHHRNTVDSDDDDHNDDKDDDDDDDDDDADNTLNETLTDIKTEIVEAKPLSDSLCEKTVKIVTVVDTGGQPEYIHLLPAINSYPTITFIVHNVTKKLDDPVQVRYKKENCKEVPIEILNYSNLDMIHLLMCFVSDSLKQPLEETVLKQTENESHQYNIIAIPKKSYIGFVGTHCDLIKNDDLQTMQRSIDDKLDHIVNKEIFNECGHAVLRSEKGIIHLVDNTTAGDSEQEDPQVKKIRSQIELYTCDIESKPLPITWMILQLEIQELCNAHHERYITYDEYTRLANENSLHGENEIKASLEYFHFIGTLLYFQEDSLRKYVIVNLQWLYTSLARVMRLSLKEVTIHDYNLRKRFDDQRLLAKDDVDCEFHFEDLKQLELNYLFGLLVHLKIITTVTINSTEFYYLPCVSSNLKMCDDKHKHLLSEPLLIQFKSGFLPRGFFCSLVVHLLEDQPEGWEHQLHKSAKNFRDLMIFCLPDKTFLYMHDKIFYLKVEVRHGRKNFNAPYHPKLFHKLQQYLIKVCEQLRFDQGRLQYGFLCLADESDGDHITVINLPKSSETMPTELQCNRKHINVTKLDQSHYIWFEEPVTSQKSVIHSDIQKNFSSNNTSDFVEPVNDLYHYIGEYCFQPQYPVLSSIRWELGARWKHVGYILELEHHVMEHIELNIPEVQDRSFQMLVEWKQRDVKSCYCKLIYAMTKERLHEGIRNLKCQIKQSSHCAAHHTPTSLPIPKDQRQQV